MTPELVLVVAAVAGILVVAFAGVVAVAVVVIADDVRLSRRRRPPGTGVSAGVSADGSPPSEHADGGESP